MADNTQLPAGTGGDTVRTIDRGTAAQPLKTQVVQLDAGGEPLSEDAPESLVSGQNPLPVQDPYSVVNAMSLAQAAALARNAMQYSGAGFYPAENTPGFLLGVQ